MVSTVHRGMVVAPLGEAIDENVLSAEYVVRGTIAARDAIRNDAPE